MQVLYFLLSAGWLSPLALPAQELKRHEVDPLSKNIQLETYPVNLKAGNGVRMDACLSANGSAFFLTLLGSGKGTNTIDIGNETIFSLDNDSSVAIASTAVQGFESKDFVNTYKHDYTITPEALETLSRHNLRGVRKYSMLEFADIDVDEQARENLKNLSSFFLEELKKAGLLKMAQTAAAFPGGREVWLSFVNRNLKELPPLGPGGKKTGTVAFDVDSVGGIQNIRITESAGAAYDAEMLRILKRMPHWKPALVNGKQVAATVSQRVTFYLQNNAIRVSFEDK